MGRFGNICALLRNWIINILVSHNKDPAYILIAKFGSLLNTSNYVQIALISIDFPYFHIWWGFHGISRISMFGSLLNIWTRCVGWHPHVFFSGKAQRPCWPGPCLAAGRVGFAGAASHGGSPWWAIVLWISVDGKKLWFGGYLWLYIYIYIHNYYVSIPQYIIVPTTWFGIYIYMFMFMYI